MNKNKKMKHLLLGSFLSITCLLSTQVHAKFITFGKSEKIKTVKELPKTDYYAIQGSNDHLNLGIIYEQFEIAGMPIWITEEPEIVGTSSKRDDFYYDLSSKEIDYIIKENNLASANELKQLQFFDKYLGLVVIGGFLLGYILYAMLKKPNAPTR